MLAGKLFVVIYSVKISAKHAHSVFKRNASAFSSRALAFFKLSHKELQSFFPCHFHIYHLPIQL